MINFKSKQSVTHTMSSINPKCSHCMSNIQSNYDRRLNNSKIYMINRKPICISCCIDKYGIDPRKIDFERK